MLHNFWGLLDLQTAPIMKEKTDRLAYPFTAVHGQDEFKKALILTLIDPSIGGVLAVGDRGAGKTTLIRSLAQLMSSEEATFPFINLPIGATEDRLLGHVDIPKLINHKKEEVQLGLLAKAHGGILYIDEVNLLNDYLMDILLDASVSGAYFLEREGLSHRFNSKFALIGSMNPEEGQLRPQLHDRFGFCVEVKASLVASERVRIVKDRLKFDERPDAFLAGLQPKEDQLKKKILTARQQIKSIRISDENMKDCVGIALGHQVEGLRADILLMKAARALAAFQSRHEISKADIHEIAPLVLMHRTNKNDNPTDQQKSQSSRPQEHQKNEKQSNPPEVSALTPSTSLAIKNGSASTKRGGHDYNDRGNPRKSELPTHQEKTDIKKTVTQYIATGKFDLIKKHEVGKGRPQVVFLIDSSGSMLKDKAIAYAKGLVNKTVSQDQKTEFAVIAVHHSKAQLLMGFNKHMPTIQRVVGNLPIGGKTNLIAGLEQLDQLVPPHERINTKVFIFTDGKFNAGVSSNVFEETVLRCKKTFASYATVTVVDSEQGAIQLGLANTFAVRTGAVYQMMKPGGND